MRERGCEFRFEKTHRCLLFKTRIPNIYATWFCYFCINRQLEKVGDSGVDGAAADLAEHPGDLAQGRWQMRGAVEEAPQCEMR